MQESIIKLVIESNNQEEGPEDSHEEELPDPQEHESENQQEDNNEQRRDTPDEPQQGEPHDQQDNPNGEGTNNTPSSDNKQNDNNKQSQQEERSHESQRQDNNDQARKEESIADAPNTGIFSGGTINYVGTGCSIVIVAFCTVVLFKHISKKRQSSKFTLKKHVTNEKKKRICASFSLFALMILAFAIGRNSLAESSSDILSFTTKGELQMELNPQYGENVYCVTDEISIQNSTENGYKLSIKTLDGKLKSDNHEFSSIEEWGELEEDMWGFYGFSEDKKSNFSQIPTEKTIIVNKNYATEEDEKTSAEYCVKLPEDAESGTYTATIIYEGEPNDAVLGIRNEAENEPYEDYDGDGLLNWEEAKYGTNPNDMDTDSDGLSDSDELLKYNTNPLNRDSDYDFYTDYSEIQLNKNPLEYDNDFGRGGLTYHMEYEGVKMDISGSGNIPQTAISIFATERLSKIQNIIPRYYSFSTEGSLDNASVSIKYDDEEIMEAGIDENNLTLLYLNNQNEFELVDTIVNADKNMISAQLNHFSKYVIGDKEKLPVFQERPYSVTILPTNDEDTYHKAIAIDSTYIAPAHMGESSFVITSSIAYTIDELQRMSPSDGGGYETLMHKISRCEEYLHYNECSGEKHLIIIGRNQKDELWRDDFVQDSSFDAGFGEGIKINERLIKESKKFNISVYIIGIGPFSENDFFENIAAATGGKFILYDDADSKNISDAFSLVAEDQIDIDNDGEIDGTLIADNGFRAKANGFSFANYASNLSDGHCYGMATIAELYYAGKMPMSADAIMISHKYQNNEQSYPFDLNATNLPNQLYDFRLTTEALKYTLLRMHSEKDKPTELDFSYFGGTNILKNEIYATEPIDNKLAIKNEYKQEMLNSALYDITTAPTEIGPEEQIEDWGFNYGQVENYIFNEDKMQTSETISNPDKQVLNAIYSAFIKQDVTAFYSSSFRPLTVMDKFFKRGDYHFSYISSHFIEELANKIYNGEASVIVLNKPGEEHAVNAINLVQDKNDINKYYIKVYDNNFPGEEHYLTIRCSSMTCKNVSSQLYEGEFGIFIPWENQDKNAAYFDTNIYDVK